MTAEDRPDLGAVYDAHMRHEFVDLDLDATMATMVQEPHTYFAPTGAGGVGRAAVASFYRNHFIGKDKWPADWSITVISRTVGDDRLVEEFIVSFTHDVDMDYILPGVAPTGKHVEVPHVVVVTFEGDKIAHEHIYWDQASVLVQVGLLDPVGIPVVGAEQATKLSDLSGK
ncbi:MAG: nuclear transport factor 2 family protein [Actinomycetota bacterium]|nr:nuclear transport factor 2 family protein [Actinomycetota bacterium]